MKRTTRNAAKTKQEIIERSAPVFNINGYAGTTMQMLVEASGFQMGGIYRHFETKMDLAKAAFQYNCEILLKSNLVFTPEMNPKEKLLTIIHNYKKMIFNPIIPGGCPVLNTTTEVDDTNEVFRKLAKSYLEEILTTIEGIIEEGKSNKIFQSAIDARKEALYIFASFEGAILIGTLTKKSKPVLAVFDQIIQYLEGNIFVD